MTRNIFAIINIFLFYQLVNLQLGFVKAWELFFSTLV